MLVGEFVVGPLSGFLDTCVPVACQGSCKRIVRVHIFEFIRYIVVRLGAFTSTKYLLSKEMLEILLGRLDPQAAAPARSGQQECFAYEIQFCKPYLGPPTGK